MNISQSHDPTFSFIAGKPFVWVACTTARGSTRQCWIITACHCGAIRRRAAPRMRECWVTATTDPPPSFKLTRPYTALKMRLEENERATFCVFKLNMRWFVFSKLFNPFMSQLKREGPCQIEWLTFMASGHSRQTEMITSALISYSSVRQVKFLPPGHRCSRLWNESSSACSRIQILARLFVLCRNTPHKHTHTYTHPQETSFSLLSCLNLKPGRLWLCREGRYIPNIPRGQWTGRANRWPADCPVPPPAFNREQKSPLKGKKIPLNGWSKKKSGSGEYPVQISLR